MYELSNDKDSQLYSLVNIKINDLFLDLEKTKKKFFAAEENRMLNEKEIGEIFVTSAAHLLIYSLMSCVANLEGRMHIIDMMKAQVLGLQPEDCGTAQGSSETSPQMNSQGFYSDKKDCDSVKTESLEDGLEVI